MAKEDPTERYPFGFYEEGDYRLVPATPSDLLNEMSRILGEIQGEMRLTKSKVDRVRTLLGRVKGATGL
jgi:hypothetical protein